MSTESLRIVIVGGVAGGASAATRARRCNENAEIILLERDDYVSFANCGLPYHIGGEIAERRKLLVTTRELLQQRFRLDVRIRHEAVRIDRATSTLIVRDGESGLEYDLPYDRLILSPGAAPLVPPIPGVDAAGVFTLRNVVDMDRIIEAAANSGQKKAVVVGAGFIGLEMVEQLVRIGFQVSLAELQTQVLPPMDPEMVVPLQDELQAHGVSLHCGDGIRAIRTDESGNAAGVVLQSGRTIDGDLIILGLGVRPNTQLAIAAGLTIGATGGISVNRFQQTSDPNIYAVGDVCEYQFGPTSQMMRVSLAGPANRSGRLAGQHAATANCHPMSAVQGTAIVRVFEQTAGMTGLSVKTAAAAKIAVSCVTVVAGQHAGYFPGATPITLKLIFETVSGRVVGAQAVGKDGVDKRIDVIATAMQFGATVNDLTQLDLAYAPPFGSAKDPIHQAAFTACNHREGWGTVIDSHADLTGLQVVDVRTAQEIQKSPLAGCDDAISMTVDELRDRLSELDRHRKTVVSCGVGVRGHVAQQILNQHGFDDVANLSGGATVRNRAMRAKLTPEC